jgi:formylglycine-generating enzyme required for sulfatase activity
MKNTIKQVLETLKNTFGDSIFTDPKRFKAAIADTPIESDGKYIRFLLSIAICDMKAYSHLETPHSNKDFIVGNLIAEMSTDYIRGDNAAAQAVIESIAELLGYTPSVQSQLTTRSAQPNSQTVNSTPKVILCSIVGEMVFVQGGTFKMGGTPEQGSNCYDQEKPVHDVTVSDFYIGKYLVTQRLWKQVMGYNPSNFPKDVARPVERVNWYDVQQFIIKLNQQTDKVYRLPTEAEWEYAARGGNKSRGYKYAGSNNIDDVAWYDKNSNRETYPIGTKHPNELGIYDMSGNVREWVSDWYGAYSANAETNPQGPSSGSDCMNRGGSWSDGAEVCRVSFRGRGRDLDRRDNSIGFRLALPSP